MPREDLGVLEILELRVIRGEPRLTRERVEAPAGLTLEVALPHARVPDGFTATKDGALHYKQLDGVSSVVRRMKIEHLENKHEITYRWTEIASSGAQLAALVLPKGFHLQRVDPVPVAATVVGERLMVFWTDQCQPIAIDAGVFDGDLETEASRLNGGSPTRGKLPSSTGIQLIRPASKRSWLLPVLAAGVLAIALAVYVKTTPGNDGESTGPPQWTPDEAPRITESYSASHALVVGVNEYPSEKWSNLTYATPDAVGIARFLEGHGFEVKTLLDEKATKHAILRYLENELAPRLRRNDRVLFFFAGHGYTQELGGNQWGYIVPYDADDDSATYISMDKLRELSMKMNEAKHQLYILDACFGGLMAATSGSLDPEQANYIGAVMRRPARQVLTAGGPNQQVVDGYGPEGYGLFTGHLLEALEQRLADTDSDGYVTVSELYGYLFTRATNDYQDPAFATLPAHGMGEFIFDVDAKWEEPEVSDE